MSVRLTDLSDDALLELLRAGDGAAFAELFERYEGLLVAFAHKKLGDREAARDILQDIFVALWRGRAELSVKGTLAAYLYSAVLNRVRDGYRRQLVREEHVARLQALVEASAEGADFRIREKDIAALISREVAALPEKMREVFLLRKDAFLSNREIAERLGISEQTVETHMKRALKTLRSRLGTAVFLLYVLN